MIYSLRALSLVSSPKLACLHKYPNLINKLLTEKIFIPHTLRAITDLVTEELIDVIYDNIIKLIQTENVYIRKLAFSFIFSSARKIQFDIRRLRNIIAICSLDFDFLYLLLQCFTELFKIYDLGFELPLYITPVMDNCDFYIFSKICILFSFINLNCVYDSCLSLIASRVTNDKYCYASGVIAMKLPEDSLHKKHILNKLTNHIMNMTNESTIVLYLDMLLSISPNFTPTNDFMQKLLDNKSPKVHTIGEMLSKKLNKRTFQELITTLIKEQDDYYFDVIFKIIPSTDNSFSEVIFRLLAVENNWSLTLACRALKNIKHEYVSGVVMTSRGLNQIPDNKVGYQFIHLIEEYSTDELDLHSIMRSFNPNNSDEMNQSLLRALLNVRIRTGFSIDPRNKSIIERYTTSNDRETRQLSLELLSLFE